MRLFLSLCVLSMLSISCKTADVATGTSDTSSAIRALTAKKAGCGESCGCKNKRKVAGKATDKTSCGCKGKDKKGS